MLIIIAICIAVVLKAYGRFKIDSAIAYSIKKAARKRR